ncbi:MAG TPA: TIGR03118 family protein [Gaiellaceae bacterium]|nr:TIGR03118 family protein [Gaiellaceae bacterium]
MLRTPLGVGVAVAAVVVVAVAVYLGRSGSSGYVVHRLVSDGGVPALATDKALVNGWGLAATPGGVWWTTNEASGTSTLYSGSGRKQLLTVSVPGGPTGITAYGGSGFRVSAGGASDPARFVYACEDGRIRAWTPTVPRGWSTQSEIVVDRAAEGAIFRGVAIAGGRLYVTDFHNDRVDVFDSGWRRVRLPGSFADPAVSPWFAPDNIQAFGGHLFVTFVGRAPVNGNDAPTGGYVDEFDLNGRLVAPVARMGILNEPWGLALAPSSFGRYAGDLLVANFGDGHVNAFRKSSGRWAFDGALAGSNGRPIAVNGLWGIAFGNGAAAGAKDELFFSSGPHLWRGPTELSTHGLFGSISAA